MRRHRLVYRSFIAVAKGVGLVAALCAPAMAQRVSGVVRDSASGEPLTGAVVSLLDSAGTALTRGVANAEGRFSLARFRETTRLAVIRIGYAPRELAVGADSTITVTMRAIPAALSVVTATSRRVCPGETEGGQALALWEQARAALLAAVLARELDAPRIGLISFSREREPFQRRIEDESRSSKFITADRPYVAGRPAWAFANEGYMREEPGGDRTYFAPDEAVLLDESFASTHCLHAVSGTGNHAEEVGIAFDPITSGGRDTLVDVKGVLWVDRAVRTLRSIEFEYTGLERIAKGSGGEVTFRVMPNGAPMIQKWMIHSAVIATDLETSITGIARRPPPRTERSNVRLLGYHEDGGEVAFAQWNNGLQWRPPFPQLKGVVVDTGGHLVSGAVVRLNNYLFDDSLVTDALGAFHFPPVTFGVYRVFVSDSLLAAFGIPTLPRQVLLSAADQELVLHVRPPGEAMTSACARNGESAPGTAAILGRVVGTDGAPAAAVQVFASWRAADSTTGSRRAKADDDGRFTICGVARNATIDITSERRQERASLRLDSLAADVVGVTLLLQPRPR